MGKRTIQKELIEQQSLKIFTEQAYLDYSMFVILDRALPHIGDGLKPVQRRIVYAMSELSLHALAKFKKSARTIGDVLGKYHPHGEVACYEAMVMMAQPFSYRYPLIDGQGNWGAQDDPKSFAAMRYTEARLSKYAEVLLAELDQGTAEWIPNFDGTLDEPKVLPARLPNVLLNGATGIAVGMATDIPPHNLREIANACIHLLENPKCSVEDLCRHVQGPDFATEAEIITPKDELMKIYQTGNGTLRMRAVYVIEDGSIVITALPYLVSGSKVLEQIAQLMQAKKLPMISDLRDESDHENPTRIVIIPRSNRVDLEEVMGHLFATTSLENTYRVNLNMIGLDGRPKVFDLRTLLTQWLVFRTEVVRKRLEHRLEKVKTRLHILEGMLIAYLNLDKVIKIIRTEEHPKPVLQKTFKLSEQQAEAILELKLRHLAKLEEIKINQEKKALDEERDTLEKHLSSEARLKTLIKKEIEQDAKQYGDKRRSPIVVRKEAQVMSILEKVPSEPVTVVLSTKGWVRSAKGHDIDPTSLSYKAGDAYLASIHGKSDQNVIFMDSTGRAYTVAAHNLPSARGQGEPLTGRVDTPAGATFEALLMGESRDRYLMLSRAGYGFLTTFEQLLGKNRTGKSIIKVPEGSNVVSPALITDSHTHVALLTTDGKLLLISVSEIPEMTQGKGAKLIGISKEKRGNAEGIAMVVGIGKNQEFTIVAGKKKLTLSSKDWKAYVGEIGSKGMKLPKEFSKAQSVLVES